MLFRSRRYLQRMRMVQTQKILMPGASEPMNQELKQTQDYALLVAKERPEGGRELQLDNTGFTMEMKMGDTTMLKFDSKSDPKEDGSNPLAPVLRKMVAAPPFKFLLAADGKVDKVEGVKELLDSLGSEGPPEVQMMLKGMLSEDNFKQMGALPQGLPEKPVKLGERWPVKMDVALGPLGGISIHMQYTLKGWEQRDGRKCALLEHTGTILTKPGGEKAMFNMNITGGSTSGKTWFDPELGMMVESNGTQTMSLKLEVNAQTITTQITQMITNKLVEVTTPAK